MSQDDARARARQRAEALLGGAGPRNDGAIWFPGLDGDGWDVFQKGLIAFILAADKEAAALCERAEKAEAGLARAREDEERWGEAHDLAADQRDAALAAKVEAERRLGEAVRAGRMLLESLEEYVRQSMHRNPEWSPGIDAMTAFLAAAPLPGDGAET